MKFFSISLLGGLAAALLGNNFFFRGLLRLFRKRENEVPFLQVGRYNCSRQKAGGREVQKSGLYIC